MTRFTDGLHGSLLAPPRLIWHRFNAGQFRLRGARSASSSPGLADGWFGGTGIDLFEATEEIARADGSAGWNMMISNAVSSFVYNGADAKARREVFGDGPVACWATLLPKANSVEVPGGYRVSGNFAWGSSSSLSRWVLVAGPVPDRDGQQWFRAHLLPKDDVDIKEGSWDVMDLRATASIDYSITDKFVPAYRAFEYPLLTDGNPRHPSALGLVELGRPGMTAFASGIGFRALAELITAAPKPNASSPKGCRPTITSCNSGSASWREGCALPVRIISVSSPSRMERLPRAACWIRSALSMRCKRCRSQSG